MLTTTIPASWARLHAETSALESAGAITIASTPWAIISSTSATWRLRSRSSLMPLTISSYSPACSLLVLLGALRPSSRRTRWPATSSPGRSVASRRNYAAARSRSWRCQGDHRHCNLRAAWQPAREPVDDPRIERRIRFVHPQNESAQL